mgnify:CR=1 FL=1
MGMKPGVRIRMSNCCRQTCRLWSSRDLLGNLLTGNSGDFLATNLLLLIVAQPNERQGVPLLSHTRCLDSSIGASGTEPFDLREESTHHQIRTLGEGRPTEYLRFIPMEVHDELNVLGRIFRIGSEWECILRHSLQPERLGSSRRSGHRHGVSRCADICAGARSSFCRTHRRCGC